jgi:hypothetical protein
MECFATFIVVLFICLWALGSSARGWSRTRQQRQLFTQLARQFGGLAIAGSPFSRPSLRLRYGETWGIVSESRTHGPFPGPAFQVQMHWPHSDVACEIFSRISLGPAWAYTRKWRTVEFSGEFGRDFEVTGDDSSQIFKLLTEGVQWQIERLASIGPDRRLHILVQYGRITVRKPWTQLRGDVPAQIVQGTLELYDQCMLARVVGIHFLNSDVAQPLEQVICKVCGDEIHEQMVVCRRCKTPHHEDCWHYTGACSVFGCRETTFIAPPRGHKPPAM